MKKIGLIIDSSSGLTMKEANDRGHGFIPLQISINDDVKKAGIDLEINNLYECMKDKKNVEIKTSLPLGSDIEAAFEWALERYDEAIYIGLSHKLSGTQNAVRNISSLNDKYKDKIHVYHSQYSSPWTKLYVDEVKELLIQNDDIEIIFERLDRANEHMYGLLSPGDIYWFYKGGRISKGAYMAGSLLKITPILTVKDGNLDKDNVIKARGVEKAMSKMIEIMKEKISTLREKGIPFTLLSMKADDEVLNERMMFKLGEEPVMNGVKIVQSGLSLEQTAHMGPGSCGLAIHVGLMDMIKNK